MVTVSDPSGTPVPVYSRSGTTIATLAASGTTQGAAAVISRFAGETVVVASVSVGNTAVLLPASAEVGDIVEVYSDDPNIGILIFCPGSETFVFGGNSVSSGSLGNRLRKVTSSTWAIVN